jgi:hypothetical protein
MNESRTEPSVSQQTLTEFLLARIAEDEAGYRAEAEGIPWLTVNGRSLWAHLLAECEAKRRIVEKYERALDSRREHPDDLATAGALLALHGVVGILASTYADHPDYREEWRG